MNSDKVIDVCSCCNVPDDPIYYDIESEYYFTCSDCACYMCCHKHECSGQCASIENVSNVS